MSSFFNVIGFPPDKPLRMWGGSGASAGAPAIFLPKDALPTYCVRLFQSALDEKEPERRNTVKLRQS
jgi:hypothetical protein